MVPLPAKVNFLRENKDPNVMRRTAHFDSVRQYLPGNVVRRELLRICVKLQSNPTFHKKESVIAVVHHPIAKHIVRESCFPNLVQVTLNASIPA